MLDKHLAQRFTLSGFTQQAGFRLFAFEEMTVDRPRVHCTVRADLDLIRRYDIRVQELPLLCRDLLERNTGPETALRLTFTEDDMRIHRDGRQAALRAGKRKTPPSKPVFVTA